MFTGRLSYIVRFGIAEIDRSVADITRLVVVHSSPRKLRVLLRNPVRNLRPNGWRWTPLVTRETVRIIRVDTLILRRRSITRRGG